MGETYYLDCNLGDWDLHELVGLSMRIPHRW